METKQKTNELETATDLPQITDLPTPAKDGLAVNYHYASEEDEQLGVETGQYPNGNKVKRVTLSSGKMAVIHELTGREMKSVDGRAAGKKDEAFPVMMALATKIDGQELVPEDFDHMKAKDWSRIKFAVAELNF